jgi:hypothetical protein
MPIGLDAWILVVLRPGFAYIWGTTWFPGLLVANRQSLEAVPRLNIVQWPPLCG